MQDRTYWRFLESASFIAYAATFILALGWTTRRSYLGYFGVDHSGIDEASPDITINYVRFGLQAIMQMPVRALDCQIANFVFIGIIIILCFVDIIFVVFYNNPGWIKKLPWREPLPIIVIMIGFLGLLFAMEFGHTAGEKIAEEELSDPFGYYRPVSLVLAPDPAEANAALTATGAGERQRFGLGRGCWMKLLMDKKNIYLFLIPPDDSYAVSNAGQSASSFQKPAEISEPPITIVRLDQVKQLDILPAQKQKNCPLARQSD